MTDIDPTLLPLDELRALRRSLQHEEDAVSYVRRVAQARFDRVDAESRRRGAVAGTPIEELTTTLGHQLTGGSSRPPRPAVDASDHPLALELERVWSEHGGTDVTSLSDADLAALHNAIRSFEQDRSKERKALFVRLDSLSAELARRYREGEAAVDGMFDEPDTEPSAQE